MSSSEFSNGEINLLKKGFKYNISPVNNKKDLEILGVDCGSVVYDSQNSNSKLSMSDIHILANLIESGAMRKAHFNNKIDRSLISSIKEKTEHREEEGQEKVVIFTRENKGNGVIAIDKKNYNAKTEEFSDSNKYINLLV